MKKIKLIFVLNRRFIKCLILKKLYIYIYKFQYKCKLNFQQSTLTIPLKPCTFSYLEYLQPKYINYYFKLVKLRPYHYMCSFSVLNLFILVLLKKQTFNNNYICEIFCMILSILFYWGIFRTSHVGALYVLFLTLG